MEQQSRRSRSRVDVFWAFAVVCRGGEEEKREKQLFIHCVQSGCLIADGLIGDDILVFSTGKFIVYHL